MPICPDRFALVAALPLLALHVAKPAPAPASSLAAVYSQMDKAAAGFQNAEADLVNEVHTKVGVIDDVTQQTGTMYVKRTGARSSFGAVIKQGGRVFHIVNYDGALVRVYNPGDNTVDLFKTGDNQAGINTVLALGFGASSKDLQSGWNITDGGPETIDGIKTEKLDLVSKDAGLRQKYFSHVTLWIDAARGVSVRQEFFSPDGTTKLTRYSNIRSNTRIKDSDFAIPQNARPIPH